MIKKYFEFIKENLNKSKAILKSKMDDYEKIKTFLTNNNSIGYMGKFTELLFSGVPYSEIITLYNSITDLKRKNIRVNIDDFDKYENILDDISRKQILYKFKNIYNKFPKEQKEMISTDDQDDVLLLSKLYDIDHEAFIKKISRYKSNREITSGIERFLSGKIKSFDKEYVKSLLDDNLKLCFENDNILIVRTLTHDSIVKVGSDTSWCIVASKSTFASYTKNGSTQYVLFDYTKDKYDVDFKIGFTLNSDYQVTHAHDILDKGIKKYTVDLLSSNNVNLSSLSPIQPLNVDIRSINLKTTLAELKGIVSDINPKRDSELFLKVISILSNKFSKSDSSYGPIMELIRLLFIKIRNDDNVIELSEFDKYKSAMGSQYNRIKERLSEDGLLLSDIAPRDIFKNIPLLLANYKNWKHDIDHIETYVDEIKRDHRLANPILYFVNMSSKSKSNKLLKEYCNMIINNNVDLNKLKDLIDELKFENDDHGYNKYLYYNMFDMYSTIF